MVTFKGRTETIEEIMGTAPLKPGVMMAKLWDYIKKNGLSYASPKKEKAPNKAVSTDATSYPEDNS